MPRGPNPHDAEAPDARDRKAPDSRDREAPDARDREAPDSRESDGLSDGRDAGLPDARDGLTRLERVILWQLHLAERERGGASVPTALLYGRVVEHIDVSIEEFQAVLSRLVGARY